MTTESSIHSAIPSLADLDDDELVECVEMMKKSNKIMDMENNLFENFLGRVDPKLLVGIHAILEQASRIQVQMDQAHASVSMPNDGLRLSKSMGSVSSTHSLSRLSMASVSDKR